MHDQHAHGHVFVGHAGRRRDVPDAKVIDERLDYGMVGGMVAIVEHPRAVALAEARVVDGRGDEVVAPAKFVKRQAERVELASVFRCVGFVFVAGDIRDDQG